MRSNSIVSVCVALILIASSISWPPSLRILNSMASVSTFFPNETLNADTNPKDVGYLLGE